MSTINPNDRFKNKISGFVPAEFEGKIRSSIVTNLINDDTYEIDRKTKYNLYWKFYKGEHYAKDNFAFLSFNYVRAFIDKINQFLLGEDCFSFVVQGYYSDIVPEEVEDAVEKLIMGVWRKNNFKTLSNDLLQMGSITGDAWMGVFFDEGIKLQLFDSRNVFVKFVNGDINNIEAVEIRNPIDSEDYKLQVYRYTKTAIESWKQEHTKSKGVSASDKKDYKKDDHELGTIPIVHIKNRPDSSGYYSTSDSEDVLKLNKIYNELSQEVKNIIDYHASPTTIITGATTKNLTKGLGKVWSGLPPEANVFNLGLDTDLSATMEFLDRIKLAMFEMSDIPEGILGKVQSISGTSAAALKLTYQPIYHRASLKALTYGEGIKDINSLILKYYAKLEADQVNSVEKELLKNIPEEFNELYTCVPLFSYGFPVDRMNLLQELQLEFQMDLVTLREALNRLGKKNIPEILKEISEDKVKKAMLLAEVNEIMGVNDMETGDEDIDDTAIEPLEKPVKPATKTKNKKAPVKVA